MQPEWAHEMRKYMHGDEIIVPAGRYFAMGDNRDRSLDSRYWGFVDRDAIMGRPFLIYWSVDCEERRLQWGKVLSGRGCPAVFETLVHLPSRTRWSRMLRTGIRIPIGDRENNCKQTSSVRSGYRLAPTFLRMTLRNFRAR